MDFRDYIVSQPARVVGVRPPVTVGPQASVAEALEEMSRRRVGCLLVTEGAALLGIFTERDLLIKVLSSRATGTMESAIRDVMTPDPVVARSEESLDKLLARMHRGKFRHVPMLDERDRLLGTVSIKRIIGFIADQFAEHVYNQPPKEDHFGSAREGA